MSIKSVFESLPTIYVPRYSTYKMYREQSIYCEFIFAINKIFVVSLNMIDNKIYVYFREKQPIDDLSEIIPGITFSYIKGTYFYGTNHLIGAEKSIFMANIIRFVDVYIDSIGFKKIQDNKNGIYEYSNQKIKIIGNYKDSKNNKIIAPKNLHNCFVQFLGGDNEIIIDENANLKNCTFEMRENGKVVIKENVKLHGNLRLGYGSYMEIGCGTTSTSSVYATIAEGTRLIIGDDCMFATNNQIRTDDAHPIYDVNTGKRLNRSKDIIIGHHVWIAYGAVVLGGAKIGDGSVIGAFSVVKKEFPNNCVVAGVPAKLIKKDIFWERPLLLNQHELGDFEMADVKLKVYAKETIENSDNE